MLQRSVSRFAVPRKTKAAGDRLTMAWGPQAPDIARILAFRAEAGLLHEPAPGFWAGVARALCHAIGVPERAASGADLLAL